MRFLCRCLCLSPARFSPFPTILMYRSQQFKQNPPINTSLDHLISQIAAECSALGEVFFFFAGKHYLMAPNQALRACCCLIVKKKVCLFCFGSCLVTPELESSRSVLVEKMSLQCNPLQTSPCCNQSLNPNVLKLNSLPS